MDDKLSIRVNVADRFYPLRIDRKDEERIRLAAKLINDKVLQYKQRYSDKDVQDFLAMASLQYVIKLLELENRHDVDPMIEAVRELNDQLEDILSDKSDQVF
ncbi:cell division protein ZapA [Carboxylicivirga linearis]|uniref:Cell division protein ZapA n=1 Tax=Carboxylicivirga linearis TaxID=1628157 RepID=A0ABS5JRD6_9BACT|nr:cell division protein ZapA [Carboxylicivirga linearis]MBS2097465.1 cell division protein ZapA [Carboxylicivirga linearis]